MNERWAPIVGFEDRYEISDDGRVRSIERRGYRGSLLLSRSIRTRSSWGQYLTFVASRKGHRKALLVHRCVAAAFIPNPQGKPEVNHIDGDKLHCHFTNLEWVTRRQNVAHAIRTGLMKPLEGCEKGDRCPASVLCEADVRVIKGLLRAGSSLQSIARRYGVSKTSIGHIKGGRTWSHVA